MKKKGIHQKSKYYLRILNHMFRISCTDGAIHFKEKLMLETTVQTWELSDVVTLDFDRCIAEKKET